MAPRLDGDGVADEAFDLGDVGFLAFLIAVPTVCLLPKRARLNSKPRTSASTRNWHRHATMVSNVSLTQKSAQYQSQTKSRHRHRQVKA